MTTGEARDRFLAAVAAQMFADQQLKILGDARIEDQDQTPALHEAVKTLTPEQLAASLQSVLALESAAASAEAAALLQFFAEGSAGGSERIALPRSSESKVDRER